MNWLFTPPQSPIVKRGWRSRGRFPVAESGFVAYLNQDIRISQGPGCPFFVKDDATAALVAQLARKRGVSKQDAVRQAVQAELQRIAEVIPLRERIAAWRKEHPLPPPTGQRADKAFFDDLSGER
jgi:antitoxin VapB